MKQATILIILTLSGCSVPTPPTVITAPPEPINLPVECTSSDEAWVNMPDTDIRQKQAVRVFERNADQYDDLLSKRKICRSAIKVLITPGH